MKKERILNLASTIGVILTGLLSAISLLQIFTSVTIIEILENQKLTGILFVLFALLFSYKYFELKSKSNSELPNIKLEGWYVDERLVTIPAKEYPEYSSQTGSNYAIISPYRDLPKDVERVDKYFFAHVIFSNAPMAYVAKNTISTIEYYDSNLNQIPIYNFYGRWGQEKEQPQKKEYMSLPKQQFRIDILPNGDKYELDIAMKHEGEGFCFAFNDTSYSSVEFRKSEYALRHNKIYVCIILNGEKLNKPSYWFELLNEGKNGGMKIKEIVAPQK